MADDWLGETFSNPYVQQGGVALGGMSDIYAFFQNYKRQQQMKAIYDILQNPSKLAAYIAKLYQPMGGQELAAVNRDLGANWSTMTGGAPGGAQAQFSADALAKIESSRYQSAAKNALEALQGASGSAAGMPTSPMGGLSGMLNILMKLRGQKQGDPSSSNLVGFPTAGGPGYSGGSEAWRDQGPFPAPVADIAL